MTLNEFMKSIPSLTWRMQTGARVALYKEGNTLVQDFEKRSPVDSGKYRRSWKMLKGYQGGISIRIANSDTEKAEWMEHGVEKGEAPWYFPRAGRRPTGKLIVRNGRVWAGGKSPGHRYTVSGAIDPVIFKNKRRQLQLTKIVADGIIKGIK